MEKARLLEELRTAERNRAVAFTRLQGQWESQHHVSQPARIAHASHSTASLINSNRYSRSCKHVAAILSTSHSQRLLESVTVCVECSTRNFTSFENPCIESCETL